MAEVKAELRELVRLGGLDLKDEVRDAQLLQRAGKKHALPDAQLGEGPPRTLPARAASCVNKTFAAHQVFDVLLDLTQLDVVPTAVTQVLHALCASNCAHLAACLAPDQNSNCAARAPAPGPEVPVQQVACKRRRAACAGEA